MQGLLRSTFYPKPFYGNLSSELFMADILVGRLWGVSGPLVAMQPGTDFLQTSLTSHKKAGSMASPTYIPKMQKTP